MKVLSPLANLILEGNTDAVSVFRDRLGELGFDNTKPDSELLSKSFFVECLEITNRDVEFSEILKTNVGEDPDPEAVKVREANTLDERIEHYVRWKGIAIDKGPSEVLAIALDLLDGE